MICIYICYIYANVFLSWAFRAPTATWQISQIYIFVKRHMSRFLLSVAVCWADVKCLGSFWYLVLVWVPQNIACCQHDWRPCASLAWVCVWSGWRCTVIISLRGEHLCVCVCVFEREREREVVLLWGNQAFFPFLRARLFEWISSFTKESSDEHLTPYSKGAPLQSTQWVTNTHMYIHTR